MHTRISKDLWKVLFQKEHINMRRLLFVLIASIFFVLNIQSQDTVDKDMNVNVNVRTENVKLPITDINGLYKTIDDLKVIITNYQDKTDIQYSALSEKVDNVMYESSEVKLVYLGDGFGITKDDIKTAVRRSATYTIIAILVPLFAVLYLWGKLYKFQEGNAKNTIMWAFLSLLVALTTGGIIKLALEAIFNSNMALLDNLQKLL